MKNHYSNFRIGNIIEFDSRVFEIDSIAYEFPTLNTTEFGIGVVDWNNISPIKITKDWLLKLGFEKGDNGLYHKGVISIDVSFDWCEIYYEDKILRTLDYIHQLQNIYYFITHKELQTQAGGV